MSNKERLSYNVHCIITDALYRGDEYAHLGEIPNEGKPFVGKLIRKKGYRMYAGRVRLIRNKQWLTNMIRLAVQDERYEDAQRFTNELKQQQNGTQTS